MLKSFKYIVVVLIVFLMLSGCGEKSKSSNIVLEASSELTTANNPKMQDVFLLEEDNAAFSISPEEFISAFNITYEKDHQLPLLSGIDEWIDYGISTEGGRKLHRYLFLIDEKSFIEPSIQLIVDEEINRVVEIITEISEESISDETVRIYREKTLYALKTVFPELSSEENENLYDKLTEDYHIFDNEEEPKPEILYYKNGKGCYSYFRSAYNKIHIIPVTQEYLQQRRADKVKIIDL